MAFKAPRPLIRRSAGDFLQRFVLGTVFVEAEIRNFGTPNKRHLKIMNDDIEIILHFQEAKYV